MPDARVVPLSRSGSADLLGLVECGGKAAHGRVWQAGQLDEVIRGGRTGFPNRRADAAAILGGLGVLGVAANLVALIREGDHEVFWRLLVPRDGSQDAHVRVPERGRALELDDDVDRARESVRATNGLTETPRGLALMGDDLDGEPGSSGLLKRPDRREDFAGLVLVRDPSPLRKRVDNEDTEIVLMAVGRGTVDDAGPRLTERLLAPEVVDRAVQAPPFDL